MRVYCLTSFDELTPYAEDWNRLADGMPLRSWEWLSTWWRHYGDQGGENPKASLFVPCVFDENETLVGLAPWYLDPSAAHGRVLRMLGSGEVCTDYLTVLCRPDMEDLVAEALAEELDRQSMGSERDAIRWDLLDMSGIAAADALVPQLAERLGRLGCETIRSEGPSFWRLELPESFDAYCKMLSHNRRSEFRSLDRKYFGTGRASIEVVQNLAELSDAIEAMIAMHQRRRHGLGETGVFDSPRYLAFLREVSQEMLRAGRLQLTRLTVDGKTAAFEYYLSGGGVIWVYQGAIEPDCFEHSPGKLVHIATIRRAIDEGGRAIDFLRGDEPYKAHFRAVPQPSVVWRIVPHRAAARLRHNLWLAGTNVKRWLKRGLSVVHAEGRQA